MEEEERGEALGREWEEGNGGGEGEKRRREWRSIFIHAKKVVNYRGLLLGVLKLNTVQWVGLTFALVLPCWCFGVCPPV